MDRFFVVNTKMMQEQAEHFRQDKRVCDVIASRIKTAQKLVQPERISAYQIVLNQVNELSRFYQNMGSAFDESADLVVKSMSANSRNLEDEAERFKFNFEG